MGVRDEIVFMILHDGLSPGKIISRRGVTAKTIFQYLDQMVGDGRLRRSDMVFSVPKRLRSAISEAKQKGNGTFEKVHKYLEDNNIKFNADDLEAVFRYGTSKDLLGELYLDLHTIELKLHRLIKKVLKKEFGADEDGWWRKGVDLRVRQTCVCRREEDEERLEEPYCYTDFIDLRTILDKQWAILGPQLPEETRADKKSLLSDLLRINRIRNWVMHPVRGQIPTEDDFEFVLSVKRKLGW